jgi:ribosomal protein S18 acetylase RimI-like enzyme
MALFDSITLREATPADEQFLRELYTSTRENEIESFGWTAQQKEAFIGLQYRARSHSYSLSYPRASNQVILLADEPIGRLLKDENPTDFLLIDIALLPRHRKRGIGKYLIEGLLAQAGSAGKGVRLHVLKLNPAKSLYERLGFCLVGEEGLYYQMMWRSAPVGE